MASTTVDDRILQAMLQASKELNIPIKNNGTIFYLDRTLPGGEPQEQVQQVMDGCMDDGYSSTPDTPAENPETPATPADDVYPDDKTPDQECYIGGSTHTGGSGNGVTLATVPEGSAFSISQLVRSVSDGTSQQRNFELCQQAGHVKNVVHTAKQLTKLCKSLNIKPTITSGYRNRQSNRNIGSTDRSSHTTGYAVDFFHSDRTQHMKIVLEMFRMFKAGKLCMNQIIWEAETRKSGVQRFGIIHFDVKPQGKGSGRFNLSPFTGGQKEGKMVTVTSEDQIRKFAEQYGLA